MSTSGGRKPRTVGTCSSSPNISIGVTTSNENENRRECDSYYESSGGGRFCYFDTNGIDSCVVYSQDAGKCTLPVG
jgi:hypothetical protein